MYIFVHIYNLKMRVFFYIVFIFFRLEDIL